MLYAMGSNRGTPYPEHAEPHIFMEVEKLTQHRANNFEASVHEADYEQEYRRLPITGESFVYDRGRNKESLNGYWHYGVDQYDTCIRAKWYAEKARDAEGRRLPLDYSFDQWEKMKIPSCWNMHEEKLFLYEGSIVLTRTFQYRAHGEGERVFLKFGAVHYEAKVFLNREYVGFHKGGSTPFFIEVSGKLQENNRILVVVNNTRKRTNVPCDNTDWFNYGGIYRDVELIRVPPVFIRDFHVELVPGSGFSQIRADVAIDGSPEGATAHLSIPELEIEADVEVREGRGSAVIQASPKLWSPGDPKLYEVSVTFGNDRVNESIGFREIKVEGMDILLNGQPIFLKGISAHEESVRNGKAVTEEEIAENFRLAKEMNCNYMRLAHYPHTEKAALLADKMGLMLWEEIPVYWAIEFGNSETYKDAENQLTELVRRDRNRASVIIWSVGNENADTEARLEFMSSLARKAKALDPARLVSAACMLDHTRHILNDRLSGHLDVIGANQYYGWYQAHFDDLIRLFENSRPDKPVVLTEFGADALAGHRGTADEKGTEDCQLDIYRKQV